MTTIFATANYVVGAGQALTFSDPGDWNLGYQIYTLDGYSTYFGATGLPDPTFTDYGTIQISSSQANAFIKGIGDNGYDFYRQSLIKIAQGGSLTVTSTGAGSSVWGYASSDWAAAFENDGVFRVTGTANAAGVSQSLAVNAILPGFINTGQFIVSADNAWGVVSGYNSSFLNAGVMEVDGVTQAMAFQGGGLQSQTLTNSGTITATATSGISYGLWVSGGFTQTVINSGTITAQQAIYHSTANDTKIVVFNSGTINGGITLNNAFGYLADGSHITNTGAIHGDIHLNGDGADTYDGRGGVMTGILHAAASYDVVFLGNDGETVDASGSQGSALIGGSGADTFTGGSGSDLIVGNGGSDSMTGGGGADTFVVTAASGATVIADFSAAQGDTINLAALGTFFSLSDVLANAVQSGPDTVVTMGAGTLTLQNVQLSSLTAADFVFYQPVTEFSGSYTIGAEQSRYVAPPWTQPIAYWLDPGASFICNGVLLVETNGTLWNAGWHPYVGGLEVGFQTSVTIGPSGSLTVTSPGSGVWAYGMEGQGSGQVIVNRGVLSVAGDAVAVGAASITGSFDNQGHIRVTSAHGAAGGVGITDGSVFTNEGEITVAGATGATGVSENVGPVSLSNSGTITVTASAATSYGLKFDGSYVGSLPYQSVVNSGVITADVAIAGGSAVAGNTAALNLYLQNTSAGVINGDILLGVGAINFSNAGTINGDIQTGLNASMAPNTGVLIANTGTINGDIDLGDGVGNTITNSGAINGAVNLEVNGATHSATYDGRGGTLSGGLYFGAAGGTAYLGADGETVHGGAGAETVYEGIGNDVIDGGGGVNTVSYALAAAGVTVSLATTAAQNTGGAGTDTLSHVQNLAGSAFNDTLTGDANDNVIDGGSGGDDHLDGGDGIDTVSFASATAGGSINLVLEHTQVTTQLFAGRFETLTNFENLTGSAFNDTLGGDSGNNVLDGGGGTNTVTYFGIQSGVTVSLALQGQAQDTVGAGTDTLINFQNLTGSFYDDTLEGDGNNNVLNGGVGGNDTASYAHAAAGVTVSLTVQGGPAQDTGGAGVDTLFSFRNLTGSAFNDTLEGDDGSNVLDGGAGTNTVSYAHGSSGVAVSLALQGQAQATGGSGSDTLSNFQNIVGSAFNDTLEGDGNNNVLDGGAGVNTVSYAHSTGGVSVSLVYQGQAYITSGAGNDTLLNFQNVVGSAFNDQLEGDGHNNVLDGGAGSNWASYAHASSGVTVSLALQGQAQNTVGAGIDTLLHFQNLYGSVDHSDILEGDGGDNMLDGGDNSVISDTVSYAHAASGVTVSLSLQGQAQNTVGAGIDRLDSFRDLIGSAFNDTLEGDANNNVIDGGAGTNTVSYAHAAAGVSVSLALQGQAQNTVGAGSDTLSNFRNLTGSAFADRLTDDSHDNVLTGGAGADTFLLSGGGNDTIADFSHAEGDKIDLTGVHLYSLADLMSSAAQNGADTVINTGSGSLTLKNVQKSNLVGADFNFSTQPRPFHINVTYDSSVNSAPPGFQTAVQAAVDYWQNTIDTAGTVNLRIGWGEVANTAMPVNALGATSPTYYGYYSYDDIVNALAVTDFGSPADLLAILLGMPAADPTHGGLFMLTTAEARALGLTTAAPAVDAYIGLASSQAYTFDPNNRTVAGKYDAIGVLEHEMAHALGRVGFTGDYGNHYTPLDLFRFTASGDRTFQPGYAYFTLNKDQALEIFNDSGNGADGDDWATGAHVDAFDAYAHLGAEADVSIADLRVMQLLGYHIADAGTPALYVSTQSGTLGAGQSLSFTGASAIVFSPTSATSGPAYTNAGTISDDGTASQVDVIGVGYDANATAALNQGVASLFTNTTSGTLSVAAVATASDAVGVYFGPSKVVNQGVIQVTSAAADAYGDIGVDYTSAATGSLTVQGLAEAGGIMLADEVRNDGTIQVSGLHASGVAYATLVNNTGTITVTGVGAGATSIGVYSSSSFLALVNSGSITAQTAIFLTGSNSASIGNTGTINGAVDLSGASATIDSHAGVINGVITLRAGSNTVTLGAENNTVSIMGGTDVVAAGGGTNTASYAGAASGVTVSLALQGSAQATGVGTDTLSQFQNLVGSAYADKLTGDTGANVLTGGGGADTFIFKTGGGHDTISDFSHAQGDRIDLTAFHVAGLTGALGHAVQSGADTVFTFGADQITLQGVTKGALTAQDLIVSTAGHDVTGTGYSAVVFRDPGGNWGYAAFNASGGYSWTPMGGSTPSFGLVGNGDFNGDGVSDLLFRESATGNWGFAQMNGSGGYLWQGMGGSTASYGEVGVGDFNGDGIADIVFREQSTGTWGIAQMHGAAYTWLVEGGSTPSYSLAGTGDFNGDGIADILFHENSTGNWGFAQMNASGGWVWNYMGGSTASYSVVGTGDFNGDGISDILFRDNRTGDWGYAQMHGTSYAWLPMGGSTASYAVVGTGDYNGDGVADIAFRERATGNWGYAAMHGTGWDWVFMGGSTQSYGAF